MNLLNGTEVDVREKEEIETKEWRRRTGDGRVERRRN